jgi:adhesin transport system outer membrane protein
MFLIKSQKMHKNITQFAALGLLSLGLTAQAQSLQEVIQKALLEYPGAQAAQANVVSAQAEIDRAKGAQMPTLSLNASSSRFDGADVQNLVTPMLVYKTPLGGRVEADIRRSESAAKIAQAKTQVNRDEVALQVAEAWLAVVRGEEMLKLAQSNMAQHEAILGDIQKIVEVDSGRSLDLVQAQVRVESARINQVQRQAELMQAKERLARFWSQPLNASVFGAYPTLSKAIVADESQALAQIQSLPTVVQAQAQLQEAQAKVDAAKTQYNPTLDFTLAREYTGVARGNQAKLQAQFSWPIYNGRQTDAGVRSAQALAVAAKDTLSEVELMARERVRLSYTDWASAKTRAEIASVQRTRGEKLVAGYQQQFRMARRSLLDLLNIQGEFASYQQSAALAQYDVKLAEYRISAALGQLAANYAQP